MSQSKPDSAAAGKVYRPRLRSRVFFSALGLGLLWAGSSLAIWANTEPGAIIASRVIATAVAVLIAAPGAYLAVNMFVLRAVLRPDRIETHGLFGSRTLRRDAILGYRAIDGYLLAFTFTPKPPAKRVLEVWPGPIDQEFADWFEGLTSLDLADLEEARRKVLADPALGPDEVAREVRLKRLTKLTGYSTLGLVLLLPALAFTLGPVWAGCLLAALPLVALLAVCVSRGAITQGPSTLDGLRPSVRGAGVCILVLWMFTFWFPVLDWSLAMGWASAVAVPMLMLAAFSDPRAFRRWRTWALGTLVALSYGWGLTIHGNALLDRGEPEIYQARVEALRSGNELYLAPAGPLDYPNIVDVPEAVRKAARVGQSVCLNVHPGAFGIRWYEVRECD